MTIEKLIADYGYYAIPIAVIFLGNAVIFICGILAHHGVLDIPLVVIASFMGGLFISQILFYLGQFFINKNKTQKEKFEKSSGKITEVKNRFHKSPFLVILLSRFVPGFRVIAPIVIGFLKYNRIKYFLYDIIAVICVTLILVFLGFCFGHIIEHYILGTKEYDIIIALCLTLVYALYKIFKQYREKKKKEKG